MSIDVAPDSFAGIDVAGKKGAGIGDRAHPVARRQDLEDERRGHANFAFHEGRARAAVSTAPTCTRASSSATRCVRTVRKAGAEAAIRRATARCSPPVSRKPSRRWTRWLFACCSQPRRRSASATWTPASGASPKITRWLAMMLPYSSGNTSSVRSNSWRDRMSGTASSRLLPSRDERHQAREIVECHALDEAERAYVAVRSVGSRRVQPVGHERMQPRAEDGAEIGNERIERCALTIRQPCR